MDPNVYCSTIYNSWYLEATQISIEDWIKKLWYKYTMEYYSSIKRNTSESILTRWINLDPIIQSEVREKQMLYINAYIWNLEGRYWWNCLQSSNGDTEIEETLTDKGRGEEGAVRWMERGAWKHWRRQWHPTPVLLPGKSHGQRSLVGCSPWGHKESDMTEWLHFHFSLSCTGEGNGSPLQCSCLENPRDGRAWRAAIYGTAQSQTPQKQLSSSSNMEAYTPTYVNRQPLGICCTWTQETKTRAL